MDRVTEAEREFEEVNRGVHLADLAAGEQASMSYWRVDPGERIPPHRHDNEQIGYLISGRLVALVEGEEILLEPGDSYVFPSGERHGCENRGDEPAVGVGILSPPRDNPDWGEQGTGEADPVESDD